MVISNNYEHDNNKDNKKDNKVEGGGRVNHHPTTRSMYQTSTLDPSIMVHTKRPLSAYVSHDLTKPTLLVHAPDRP